MPHVLIDLAIDPAAVEQLGRLPGVVLHQPEPSAKPVSRPPELLRQIDVLMCKHPPANFDDLTSLRLWQLATVGYDHLTYLKLAERTFTVCNARGIFDTGIVEWNVAMMVNLARNVRGMIRNQEQGIWDRSERFQQEVRGKVVGMWGYGGIGRETARLAKALGMTVHVLTRRGVQARLDDFTPAGTGDPEGKLPDRVFVAGQEQEFLAGLDFLILALPQTQVTTGMVGEVELQALPRTANVLNPARGPIIQEPALLKALAEGWIAGAALDTHYHYPMPPDHPLWHMPNVIMTPHISGADRSSRFPEMMGELCVENLSRLIEGRPLLNVVTREDLRESCSEPVRYGSM